MIPRPRITVRRLMVAVAVVAILLGVGQWMQRRSATFRLRATLHLYNVLSLGQDGQSLEQIFLELTGSREEDVSAVLRGLES